MALLPLPRTNRTSLVPPLVLSGHAASLTADAGSAGLGCGGCLDRARNALRVEGCDDLAETPRVGRVEDLVHLRGSGSCFTK